MSVEGLLTQIRDLIAHRGIDAKPTMPTANRGTETPLVMASIMAGPQSMVGKGPQYQGFIRFDTHHYTLGEIFVVVNSTKPAAIAVYGCEVRVTGWVGSIPDVLSVAFVNSNTGPLRVALPIGSVYDSIAIDAVQIVNGAPSGDTPETNNNLVGAALDIMHLTRIYR